MNKNTYLYVTLLSLIFCSHVVMAQQPCAADQKYWDMVAKYPALLEYEKAFDAQLDQQLQHSTNGNLLRTTIAIDDTTIFDIPIVLHVVHDYGAENLSDNLLYDAAAYWAQVYMCQLTDTVNVIAPFKKWVGNPRMRLHLATIDPNGKPTKGVTRHMSYLTGVADDGAKFDPWPQDKYVNIWFIQAFGASSAGAAAYAYLPGMVSFAPMYDGIICLADYANRDKTIPHEMGHVLNLWHPWGNSNNPAVACGDDHVYDTPPTKGHNPTGCTAASIYDTACASGYQVHFTAAGGGDSLVDYPDTANSQNNMDYTYCQLMFTKGQCYRMRTALTSATAGRNNLISASNLAATGALAPYPDLKPVADFIVDRSQGSAFSNDSRNYFLAFNSPNKFEFRNTSWNDTITGINWIFSNGATTPASTSMGIQLNQFATPGWVTVTQIATANSGSDTLVNTHAVYAADTTAIQPLGFVQEFDEANCSNWPMFNYYKNNFYWQFYTGASYSGDGKCVRYRSFDTTDRSVGTAVGDHDDFFTPAFNLAGITGNLYFNFHSAGARINSGGTTDSMEIDASNNGGIKWTRIGGISGTALANNTATNLEFVPSNINQWKGHSINIPTTNRTANTYFRFRYWPGDVGNNCYLDNFYIFPFPTEVMDATSQSGTFKLYPNPTSNGCNVMFKTGASGNATIMVRDVTGRTIYSNSSEYAPEAVTEVNLTSSVTPIKGVYFVTVVVDGVSGTEKLVVY